LFNHFGDSKWSGLVFLMLFLNFKNVFSAPIEVRNLPDYNAGVGYINIKFTELMLYTPRLSN